MKKIVFTAFLMIIFCSSMTHGVPPTAEGPRFIAEPEDRVVVSSMNTTLRLPCSVEGFPNVNVTVTWYRDDQVLQTDNTHIIQDNGTLEITVIMEGVDATVEGLVYHCIVSNEAGSVISRSALIQYASFRNDWNGVASNTTMIDVTLESYILLPCNPPMANPAPIVKWTIDSSSIDISTTDKYKVLPSGDLIVGNIVLSDITDGVNPRMYQCHVINRLIFETIVSPYSYQLRQVDRYSENLTIYNTLQQNTMLQNGSDAELVCLAIANDITRLEVFYNRAGFQDLDDNMRGPMSTINTNIDRRYTLFIDRVREDNAGDYICLVGDFITGSVTVLNVVPFTISVFAPPSIISSPNNTLLYTGDTTTMQCVTNAIPDPSVTYFYNAMPLPSNVIENGKLTLSNVTSTDSGVYQCFAQNTHGSASASWTVIVTDPIGPVVVKMSENGTVPPGNNLTITIEVTADPAPEVVWTLNSDRIDIPTNFTTSQLGNSTVTTSQSGNSTAQSGNSTAQSGNSTANTFQSGNSTAVECFATSENSTDSCPFTGQGNTTTTSDRRSFTIRPHNTTICPVSYLVELQVTDFTAEDSGLYTANITNRGGTIQISFLHLLEVPAEITKIVAVEDDCLINGRNSSLMCVVTGVPQPTIRWFMGGDDNDRRINITDSSKYSVMGEILVIINITNDDANEYGCVATNIVDGMLQTDETSENFPLCAPGLVSNLQAQFTPFNATTGLYTITWMPPPSDNGSFYQILDYSFSSAYTIGPLYSGSFSIRLEDKRQASYSISNALYFTNYTITITTINRRYNISIGPVQIMDQTPSGAPTAVNDLSTVASSAESIFISWKHPAYPNSQLTQYIIYYRINSLVLQLSPNISNEDFVTVTVPGNMLSLNLTGLETFTDYSIHMSVRGEGVSDAPIETEIIARTNTSVPTVNPTVPTTLSPPRAPTTNTITVVLPPPYQIDTGELYVYGVIVVSGDEINSTPRDIITGNNNQLPPPYPDRDGVYTAAAWQNIDDVPLTFVAGDGETTTLLDGTRYVNRQLSEDTLYGVFYYVRLQSDTGNVDDGPLIVDNDFITVDRTTSSDDDDNTAGIAVGVTISIIAVIVMIIIVGFISMIWYNRQHQKKSSHQGHESGYAEQYVMANHVVLDSSNVTAPSDVATTQANSNTREIGVNINTTKEN